MKTFQTPNPTHPTTTPATRPLPTPPLTLNPATLPSSLNPICLAPPTMAKRQTPLTLTLGIHAEATSS